MELTSEDAALLLIVSENVHLKLKSEGNRVHEINQLRGQYGDPCGAVHHKGHHVHLLRVLLPKHRN